MNLLQNRNRLTDIENKLMVTRRKEGGINEEYEYGINSYVSSVQSLSRV